MKKWFAYAAYVLIAAIVCLYYLFPSGSVVDYIQYQASCSIPDCKLSIRQAKPAFPPGLTLYGPELVWQSKPVFTADWFKVRPEYTSVFSSEKLFDFTGEAYGGEFAGTVTVTPGQSAPQSQLKLEFKDFLLNQITVLKNSMTHEISGLAHGKIEFDNRSDPRGQGNAQINVSDCVLKFNPPLFGINQLGFKAIKGELELANQRVVIKELNVDSLDVSGSASGTIVLNAPIEKSSLNIAGRIIPQPAFIKKMGSLFPMALLSEKKLREGGIPFRISGTAEHPNFSMR